MEIITPFLVVLGSLAIGVLIGLFMWEITQYVSQSPARAQKKKIDRLHRKMCKIASFGERYGTSGTVQHVLEGKELTDALETFFTGDKPSFDDLLKEGAKKVKEHAQIERELDERPAFTIEDHKLKRSYPGGKHTLRDLLLTYDVIEIRLRENAF